MGIFGWSYPPGCSGPPEHDIYCQVCGEHEDKCDCPECEICGDFGNPECYEKHGLIKGKEMTAKAINEKPILFRGDMVRAILEGRKTQTRRVIDLDIACAMDVGRGPEDTEACYPWYETRDGDHVPVTTLCPFGRIGERLWVRETWQLLSFHIDRETNAVDDFKEWQGEIPKKKPEDWTIIYRAYNEWPEEKEDRGFNWRPSIHMPRWASRINLEITNIRVERLKDISEKDAVAEGIPRLQGGACFEFMNLWDSLADEKTNWQANPYVWIIDFKRVEG